MRRVRPPSALRPGLRAAVVSASSILVIGTAVAVSATVSEHLKQAAIDEAAASAASVVRGYVDPMVGSGTLADLTTAQRAAIDAQLERLAVAPRRSCGSRSGRRTARSSRPTFRRCAAAPSRSTTTSARSLEGNVGDRLLGGIRRRERVRAWPRRRRSWRSTCRSGRAARPSRSAPTRSTRTPRRSRRQIAQTRTGRAAHRRRRWRSGCSPLLFAGLLRGVAPARPPEHAPAPRARNASGRSSRTRSTST